MNLNKIGAVLTNKASRSVLVVKKFSPEILVGVGIVGLIGSTVMACNATLKVDAVLAVAKEKKDKIDKMTEYANSRIDFDENDYTPQDRQKDLLITYVQTGADFAKLYGPAVLLGGLSIACILGSYNIMRKRNIAVVAAYKVLKDGFDKYRERVVEDLGAEKDLEYRHGTKMEKVEETVTDPETGKKKKTKKDVATYDSNHVSQYARFFDESCPQWSKTPEYNLLFLKTQQNYANDLLHARGHLFLNEVYDMLGMKHTQEGSVTGWVLSDDSDNFVDFGIFDVRRKAAREFVNGDERSILLDFNVDGIIWDKI